MEVEGFTAGVVGLGFRATTYASRLSCSAIYQKGRHSSFKVKRLGSIPHPVMGITRDYCRYKKAILTPCFCKGNISLGADKGFGVLEVKSFGQSEREFWKIIFGLPGGNPKLQKCGNDPNTSLDSGRAPHFDEGTAFPRYGDKM